MTPLTGLVALLTVFLIAAVFLAVASISAKVNKLGSSIDDNGQ